MTGVEDDGRRVDVCVLDQPPQRLSYARRGRMLVAQHEPPLGRHAVLREGSNDAVGVVHSPAKVALGAGVVVDADDDGPDAALTAGVGYLSVHGHVRRLRNQGGLDARGRRGGVARCGWSRACGGQPGGGSIRCGRHRHERRIAPWVLGRRRRGHGQENEHCGRCGMDPTAADVLCRASTTHRQLSADASRTACNLPSLRRRLPLGGCVARVVLPDRRMAASFSPR
jgi:hypothetical protein